MMPGGATDCHHHIYDGRYPTDPRLSHVPPDAPVEAYKALQRTLGLTRNVVVQPSIYGTDNRCTLDALAAFGPSARGVAVVDTSVSEAELARLHDAGIRGIRFNLIQVAATMAEMLAPLAARVNEFGWHIQLNVSADQIVDLADTLRALPCPVVFDHCGHIPHPAGVAHPAMVVILQMLGEGQAWVKLSGPYLDSRKGPPAYEDVAQVAWAYAAKAPARVLWGSDWPHPTAKGEKPDDASLLALLAHWIPDESARRRVLVDNPGTLYQFT